MKKWQNFQNSTLRNFIKHRNDDENDIEIIHRNNKCEAINTRMRRRAEKVWERLTEHEPELINNTMEANNSEWSDHYWWRRLGGYMEEDPPEEVF